MADDYVEDEDYVAPTRREQGVIDNDKDRARLEATALVASKVSREESHILVHREKLRTLIREAIIALLVVAVGFLAYRQSGETSRIKQAVIHSAQVNCKQYKDAAIIPLVPAGQPGASGAVGLALIADFRNSYYSYKCYDVPGFDRLGPPDKQLLPYLDDAAKGD